MPKLCSWFTETPSYKRCMNFAEPGESRCKEHKISKKREGDMARAIRNEVWESYDGICAICGQPGYEVDHIDELDSFPVHQRWRANLKTNLQVLCFMCHSKKTRDYNHSLGADMDPNNRTTSHRNRKRKRLRREGFGV